MSDFYKNYIEANMFVLVLLMIFVGFLIYRYWAKKENNDITEEFYPTFNPGIPVKNQQSFTNYLPNNEKINFNLSDGGYDGVYLSRNEVCPQPKIYEEFPPIILPPQERDVFVGTENDYINAQDPIVPHPYGWDTRFNTSTGSAVDWMAGANRQSLNEAAKIMFDKERNMLNGITQNTYDSYALI